ncbi:hypothetical protein B0T11DRAFT_318922 [Plectosphaerella cucumerina]|uniref:Uncharacterized protein n=1 Tax=Plectosphaerella cucumerina TaxID=40658 RepID=A0A8K0TFF6_9PEZI|nr:hypothetical protein B0T11DRAFT_318922 [Plectosphaerella cucumerina]
MAPRQSKKATRRNISALLRKCEEYSNLGDIEVALYISFPKQEGFISYESADLSWRGDIEAKRTQAPPTLHLTGPLAKQIGHKVTGFYFEQKRGKKDKDKDEDKNKAGTIRQSTTRTILGDPKRLGRPPVRACRTAGKGAAGDCPTLRFPAFPPMPDPRIPCLVEWARQVQGAA